MLTTHCKLKMYILLVTSYDYANSTDNGEISNFICQCEIKDTETRSSEVAIYRYNRNNTIFVSNYTLQHGETCNCVVQQENGVTYPSTNQDDWAPYPSSSHGVNEQGKRLNYN